MAKRETKTDPVAPTAPEPQPAVADPDETRIAKLAYQLWIERGCPIGSDQADWFQAEEMLKGRREETLIKAAVSP